ncbi:hypothetical protein BpHYR1_013792 [Brachionus plicatilis]|uniref:Uncharacterized protein n=1 Tax=Brachionus plicatilis TaxID=10195 RepID=A0A3M7S7B9_BRAPC|nr:hypothetical protein BpHYR1_013792 [Brachionus plicatilis]
MNSELEPDQLNGMRTSSFSRSSDNRTSSTMTLSNNLNPITNRFRNMNLNEKKGFHVEYFKKSKSGQCLSEESSSGKDEVKIEKKKSLTSPNERRKLNQNNIEDKLLILAQKNLDKRLSYSQLMIKREKALLLEQLMDTQAVNGDNLDREYVMCEFEVRETLSTSRIRTAAHLKDCSTRSIDVGHQKKNVFDKFIEQKRRNLPSYLKHNTRQSTASFYDLKKVIERIRRVNSTNRKICSRYQKHCKAEQRAQYYVSNKYLFKTFPELSQTLAAQQSLAQPSDEHDPAQNLILTNQETKIGNQISLPTIES